MAITRNQHHAPRALFMTELHNSLPRVALGSDTDSEVNRKSIERSIEADRWLRDHGFDRWGRPRSARPRRRRRD